MLIYRGKLDWYQYAVNEAFTIIFPTKLELGEPAYAAWQWTLDGSGTAKVNCFSIGTVDTLTVTAAERKLGFHHDRYYRFDATFSEDMKGMTVMMSNEKGDKAEKTANLTLHYDASLNDPTVPRLYLGKMNWYEYAENEMFLVVAPGSMDNGKNICAYWEWTKTGAGDNKYNVDDKDSISAVKKFTGGEQITFHQGENGYYTFVGDVYEDKKQLSVMMSNPAGDKQGPFVLQLQDLTPSSSRKKRAVVNHTIELKNDLHEVLACSLQNSGTSTVDSVLAVVGLLLAGAGIVAAYPAFGVSVLGGLVLAHVSWVAALGGAVQVFNSGDGEKATILFYDDSLRRTSSGGVAISDNDAYVLRTKMISDQELGIYRYKKEKLGDGTLSLSEFLRNSASELLLPIRLSSPHRLEAYRTVSIPKLKPANAGKDINDMKAGDLLGALTSTSRGDATWYGNMADYYAAGWQKGDTMFKHDSACSMQVMQGRARTDDYFHVIVAKRSTVRKDTGDWIYLLRLDRCTIGGSVYSRDIDRDLGTASTDTEVVEKIRDNSSYWAYSWQGVGKNLVGTVSGEDWEIQYTGGDACVYFVVESWSPFQILVQKS